MLDIGYCTVHSSHIIPLKRHVGEVSPLELCCKSAVPGLGSLGRTNNTLDLLGNCTQPMEQYGADLRAMSDEASTLHIHTLKPLPQFSFANHSCLQLPMAK